MTHRRVALLFPGQGAYAPDALAQLSGFLPEVRGMVMEVDRVAREQLGISLAAVLLDVPRTPELAELRSRAPALIDLSIYTIEICTHAALRTSGVVGDVYVGHSFGEIAALVAAGALTVAQGAELVCQRVVALQHSCARGAMSALATDSETLQRILAVPASLQCGIAAVNAPLQTVIAGVPEAVEKVEGIAGVVGIAAHRLPVDYPFHYGPMTQRSAEEFAVRVRHIRGVVPRASVYSPILGRYYTGEDHVGECLARQMAMPVQFAGAIQRLHGEGARVFVECGARRTLAGLCAAVLASREAEIVACLAGTGDGQPLAEALERLRVAQVLPQTDLRGLRDVVLPDADPETFQRFWQEHGPRLRAEVRGAFLQFLADDERPVAASAATDADITRAADDLWPEIRRMYATTLEYPPEELTPDAELEAELGVDSVKQMEMLSRLQERYGLPPLPDEFRLTTLNTLGKVVDYIAAAHVGGPR